ncbi:hypothetical protein GCM10011506_10830 [Marivirga lumbricoides]|uniref:DUF4374 domain-containing protein n=3 Tax=Marivirga lumbricoides TaxID=1046115 RepID=A0ABQ1LQB3_9BACT|nr:hypothetical protein GCM10011506_10830 [Marivirga lumbricoides]
MRILVSLFLTILLFSSCSEEEFNPESAFLQIYDDNNYNVAYKPVGLGASDSNYFMLAERNLDVSNFSGINLVVADLEGTFKNEIQLEDRFVAPTKGLLKVGNVHYFFCMDRNTLRPHLGIIPASGETVEFISLNVSASYPLAASLSNDNKLILLSYNPEGQTSVLSDIDVQGTVVKQVQYSIGPGNDVLSAVVNHFTKRSERLPFFCGQAPSGTYYFNGFFNYTLSLVFTTFGDEPTGVVQGQALNAGMQSLLPVGGNDFAFMGFQFSDHFISGKTTLSSTEISSSVNYFSRNIPEIAEKANSKIVSYSTTESDMVIFASETEGRQVVLYFYDTFTGSLINTYYIGTLNPFTFSDIMVFEDGSIAVMGTTYLAGRFERIYLTKISREQVLEIL